MTPRDPLRRAFVIFWVLALPLMLVPMAHAAAGWQAFAIAAVAPGLLFLLSPRDGARWGLYAAVAATLVVIGGGTYFSANLAVMTSALLILGVMAWRLLAPVGFDEKLVRYMPLLFLMVLNTGFVLLDFSVPAWDQARHYRNTLAIASPNGVPSGTGLLQGALFYDFYTPVTYWVAAAFSLLLGKTYTAVTLSLPLFWLPLGYLALERYLRRVWRATPTSAALGAFVVMGSYLAASLTKQLMLDVPALCMLIAYHLMLSRAHHLATRRGAILAGAVGGLAVLTKIHLLLFLAPLLAASVLRLLLKAWRRRSRPLAENALRNLLLHGLGFMVVLPWFMFHMDFLRFELAQVSSIGQIEGDPPPASFASLAWYATSLTRMLTLPVLVTLVLAWLPFRWNRASSRFHALVFAATLLIAWAQLTSTWNKDTRYVLPFAFLLVPGLVMLVTRLKGSRTGMLLALGVSLWTLVLNVAQVTGVPGLHLAAGPVTVFTSAGYTLPLGPQPSSTLRGPEAFATFVQLYSRLPETERPIHLRSQLDLGPAAFNGWAWSAWKDQVNPPANEVLWDDPRSQDMFQTTVRAGQNTLSVPHRPGEALVFARDAHWPSYFLFRVRQQPDALELEWLDAQDAVGVSLQATITWDELVHEIALTPRKAVRLPTSSPPDEVLLAFQAHHLGSSRWPLRFTANWTGHKDWRGGRLEPLTDRAVNGAALVSLGRSVAPSPRTEIAR